MIGFDELGRKGWLGNQMFQYASLRGIASKHGYEFCIPPDDNTRVTNYLLQDVFKLEGLKNIGYIGKQVYKHSSSDDPCHSSTFHFNQQFFEECPDDVNICGFFQTDKYFKDISSEIKKDFQFKDEILEVCTPFIESFDTPPLFIHIRRSDYVKRPEYHYNLSLDYFAEALSYFKDEPVLVFSDDIEWCKEQEMFAPDRFSFSETGDRLPLNSFLSNQHYTEGALIPYYDLCLMTLCNGGIISNSSFGWWGAWLQSNRTRPIICPAKDKWAGPKNTVDYSDVIVEEWNNI